MNTIVLHGVITEDGRLEIELPKDLPAGKVEVIIRPESVGGVRLGDIVESELAGLWADREDIPDSVEYARELRRRASRRGYGKLNND